MAQVSQVILGDPWLLKSTLTTLASTNELEIVQKTYSAGSFIVVSDDAAPAGQTVEVIAGDSATLSAAINTLIGLGNTIDLVCQTFSAAHYIVVYR